MLSYCSRCGELSGHVAATEYDVHIILANGRRRRLRQFLFGDTYTMFAFPFNCVIHVFSVIVHCRLCLLYVHLGQCTVCIVL